MSKPNLMVWLRRILVQLLTMSMLASARIHGKLAEYPTIGLLKGPLTPTRPLVKSLMLIPGIPRFVDAAVP